VFPPALSPTSSPTGLPFITPASAVVQRQQGSMRLAAAGRVRVIAPVLWL
jgi:hypothetical protein